MTLFEVAAAVCPPPADPSQPPRLGSADPHLLKVGRQRLQEFEGALAHARRGDALVSRLAQERPAEHGLGVERRPGVGLCLFANGDALAQHGFGVGPLLLLDQVQAERRQLAGVGERVGPGPLLHHRQPLPPPYLGLVELLEPLVAGDQVGDK